MATDPLQTHFIHTLYTLHTWLKEGLSIMIKDGCRRLMWHSLWLYLTVKNWNLTPNQHEYCIKNCLLVQPFITPAPLIPPINNTYPFSRVHSWFISRGRAPKMLCIPLTNLAKTNWFYSLSHSLYTAEGGHVSWWRCDQTDKYDPYTTVDTGKRYPNKDTILVSTYIGLHEYTSTHYLMPSWIDKNDPSSGLMVTYGPH